MVGRDEAKLRSVPPAVERSGAAFAVDMPVAAQPNLVFFEQFEYLIAPVFQENGRIMQENKLFPLPCRIERRFKPHKLAAHDFSVVLCALFFLVEPATGAADGILSVLKKVVVQNIYALYAVFLKESVRL